MKLLQGYSVKSNTSVFDKVSVSAKAKTVLILSSSIEELPIPKYCRRARISTSGFKRMALFFSTAPPMLLSLKLILTCKFSSLIVKTDSSGSPFTLIWIKTHKRKIKDKVKLKSTKEFPRASLTMRIKDARARSVFKNFAC